MKQIFEQIIQDTRVKLSEQFDRNFETKSFFGAPWSPTKHPIKRGSLMMRSGALRKSIRSRVSGSTITWSSSLKYAAIHNEGGEIEVTAKMKRFFWAMHYKAAGAVSKSIELSDGSRHLFVSTESKDKMRKQANSHSARAIRLNAEAAYWKSLALMKVGSKLKIEKRQFIGDHPQVGKAIDQVVAKHSQDIEKYIKNHLKPKK